MIETADGRIYWELTGKDGVAVAGGMAPTVVAAEVARAGALDFQLAMDPGWT